MKKEPLTAEEEKEIFDVQMKLGNKWADIAKLLPGRTDNIVKNYFYSTLRRELRNLLRKLYGDQESEPTEVSISKIQELMKNHNLSYSDLENENVRRLIQYLDKEGVDIPEDMKIDSQFSFAFVYILIFRKEAERATKRLNPDIYDKDDFEIIPKKQTANITENESELYVVEEGESQKLISKKSMDDTDLLVNIYNSLVMVFMSIVAKQ